MNRQSRGTAVVVLLSAVLVVVAGCASTPTAQMDFDPGFDFSAVKTIAIQPIDRTVASTVIVSDMQVSRINEALTAELARRGYQVVDNNADADLLLMDPAGAQLNDVFSLGQRLMRNGIIETTMKQAREEPRS